MSLDRISIGYDKTAHSIVLLGPEEIPEIMSGMGVKKRWTPDEDIIMEILYPTTKLSDLELILGRSSTSIRMRAYIMQIPKCKVFFANQQSENAKGRYKGCPPKPPKPVTKRAVPIIRVSKESQQMVAAMEWNIKALDSAGQFILANLTAAIIERIKGCKEINLDFLTVQDGL